MDIVKDLTERIFFALHYYEYKKGTYEPIKRIVDSKCPKEQRHELQRFTKHKLREVGYVQVAGAVMFTTVSSCLTWTATANSNWSGVTLWYCSIIFAICGVFTGAQQTLVLPEDVKNMTDKAIHDMRQVYILTGSEPERMSPFVPLVWQMPIMFLGYSVLTYLAGLSVVVVSPLSHDPQWNDQAKTVTMFFVAGLLGVVCWVMSSLVVYRARVSSEEGNFKPESQSPPSVD